VRILQLISSEGYYGAESMLVALADALSRQGRDCTVAVFRDSRDPHTEVAEEARRRGLAVEMVPCDGRWDPASMRRIRQLLGQSKADVLHSHGYKADLYGYAAARPGGAALISTCHNWPSQRPLMRAYAALDRFVLRRFDRVAAVSDSVADILRRSAIEPEKIATISNGVDLRRFRYALPNLRRELACGRDPLVGFVGRLVPGKGGEILLAAARRVIAEHPEARFVFVGDGPLRGAWQALARSLAIEDRVVFTGSRTDMPEIYASLDLVVLPSLKEGMPMCLLEALAAAKPVIATAVGAIPRIILPGVTGLLVEPGDEGGLAAAILRLLRDPELSAHCSLNGRRRATERFSCDAMARDYIGLYEQTVVSRSGKGKQEAFKLSRT
jgi:glycosyltransferase involved in cell wall biosynthesis